MFRVSLLQAWLRDLWIAFTVCLLTTSAILIPLGDLHKAGSGEGGGLERDFMQKITVPSHLKPKQIFWGLSKLLDSSSPFDLRIHWCVKLRQFPIFLLHSPPEESAPYCRERWNPVVWCKQWVLLYSFVGQHAIWVLLKVKIFFFGWKLVSRDREWWQQALPKVLQYLLH